MLEIRNWFVPSIAFVLFIYFAMFLALYIYKISGANVSFYTTNTEKEIKPETDAGKLLKGISENFNK